MPSFTIPPGNPGAFDQNFCPGGRGLTRAGHLTYKDQLIADANEIQRFTCNFTYFLLIKLCPPYEFVKFIKGRMLKSTVNPL